jgi:uncharacterized protein (DUF433 family)
MALVPILALGQGLVPLMAIIGDAREAAENLNDLEMHLAPTHDSLDCFHRKYGLINMDMAAAEQTTHIHRDAQGRAWIDDTNVKVIEVVQDYLAYGWSPEEMHLQHPHLSLAQIHAALSFYYDHQSEFDAQIQEGLKRAQSAVAESQNSPLRQKLRTLGKL